MRIGIENFVPSRLDEALDFRMKTKTALARDVGIGASSLTCYIAGTRKPSPEVFEKIYQCLGLPKEFFLNDNVLDSYDSTVKQWRSISRPRKADRKRGEVILSWLIEYYQEFFQYFELPDFTLSEQIDEFNIPEDIFSITPEVAEMAASKLRDLWGLGNLPIRNLLRTAEKAGIVVGKFNLNVPQLDAVSTYHENRPYILLNSFKQSGARARFDLAHEIGHLILHRHVTAEDMEGTNGKLVYDKIEEQAHWFAGALLLPADRFASDFWAPTFQCFVDMKAKWKVSIQAMIRRGLHLNLLTKSQYNWLNIAISKKKARQVEPLDDVIFPEKLRLFPKCIERYEEDNGFEALQELVKNYHIPFRVASELFDLDPEVCERILSGVEESKDNLISFDFRSKSNVSVPTAKPTPRTSPKTSS